MGILPQNKQRHSQIMRYNQNGKLKPKRNDNWPDYSKGLQKASIGALKNMIKYKCELCGKTFIEVPRYYLSSQIFHVCGYRNPDLTIEER